MTRGRDFADPIKVLAEVDDEWEAPFQIRNRSGGSGAVVARLLEQFANEGTIERRCGKVPGTPVYLTQFRRKQHEPSGAEFTPPPAGGID